MSPRNESGASRLPVLAGFELQDEFVCGGELANSHLNRPLAYDGFGSALRAYVADQSWGPRKTPYRQAA